MKLSRLTGCFVYFKLIGFIACQSPLIAQNLCKSSGVCFTASDNHSLQSLNSYAYVFDKYSFHFGFALNLGLIDSLDFNYINAIKVLQNNGHELIDHTPNHNTTFFIVDNIYQTFSYFAHPGVDHISAKKVCLKYDSLNLDSFLDEGDVLISGNKVISVNPGEFRNFNTGNPVTNIFLPSINKLYTYYNLKNLNINDPDTLYLLSFWNEQISALNGTFQYRKLAGNCIYMNPLGLAALLMQTKNYCIKFGFEKPVIWIQPGGNYPMITNENINTPCVSEDFKGAFTIYQKSVKGYNEYNPGNIKRFSFQGYDFFSETTPLNVIKSIIADLVARHRIAYDSHHLGSTSNLLGGWSGFISRTDSLLAWCQMKSIPVKNFSEWVSLLYDSVPNPYQNVFPFLHVDLDEDGFPDGFLKNTFGDITFSGGPLTGNNYCLRRSSQGYLLYVSGLAGIEKGINVLEFYSKGNEYDSVIVKIIYDQSNYNESFKLSCKASDWKKQRIEFNCPDTNTTVSISFYVPIEQANLSVSGISLRKKSQFTVDSVANKNYKIFANQQFQNINLYSFIQEPFFNDDSLSFSFFGNKFLACSMISPGQIQLKKPTPFWIGTDSLSVLVSNPDNYSDTLTFIFNSVFPGICKKDTLKIFQVDYEPFSLNNFYSFPPDNSAFKDSGIMYLSPQGNTWYYFIFF